MRAPLPIDAAVRAPLLYLHPPTQRPSCLMYEPENGRPRENCRYVAQEVLIADARRFAFAPELDACGFQLVDAPSIVRDFFDDAQVRSAYYAELQEIALHVTGGERAIVFDHLIRRREADRRPLSFGRHAGPTVGAVGRVHNDYTEDSGRRRLHLVLGEEAQCLDSRFCIVNIWRPLQHAVRDTPLALCDARSVRRDELVPTDIHYRERSGEIYQAVWSVTHRWAYFGQMQPHEAIVFKQFDSAVNVARFTPHAAFDLPDIPPGTPPRTSIEARVLVLF